MTASPDPDHPASADAALRHGFATAMRDPDRFGREFYRRLFELAPGVRALFPEDLGPQREKLVRALAVLVHGLDAPEALTPSLRQLGARHAGYGVHAGHYVQVGEALLDTLHALADPPLDADARATWTRLYGWIAATMLAGAEADAGTPRPASSAITSPPPGR